MSFNNKYFQPSIRLAENIYSHAITKESWESIKRYISNSDDYLSRKEKMTKYYLGNKVYIVTNHSREWNIVFRNIHEYLGDYSMELVCGNTYKLNEKSFPILLEYDHTRQSVVHIIRNGVKGIEFRMSVLYEGLESHDDDWSSREPISYSFQVLTEKGTSKENLYELLMNIEPMIIFP